MTIKELTSLTDEQALKLYRDWSEEYHCAGFADPAPEVVQAFVVKMVRDNNDNALPCSYRPEYEHEFLAEFRKITKALGG